MNTPNWKQPEPSNEAEREAGFAGAHGSADAPDFRSELCTLINKHSMENGSNTPDFILNQFLADVLMCFNKALRRRYEWYGGPVTQPATNQPNDDSDLYGQNVKAQL